MRLAEITTSPMIDWEANCQFDELGNVIAFKRESIKNHPRLKPIPQDSQTMNDAKEADKMLRAVMQPCTKEQLAFTLKKLSLHVGMGKKTPQEVEMFFLDYFEDLHQYPIKLIEDACAEYRRLPNGNEFFPSSGRLIAMIKPKFDKMQLLRRRIDAILGVNKPPVVKKKKELTLTEIIETII